LQLGQAGASAAQNAVAVFNNACAKSRLQ